MDLPELTLSQNVIHVWTLALDADASELAELSRLLDATEAARAARFHFERDRRHFTISRGMLRALLGRYLCVLPADVAFSYGERGKPFVTSPQTPLRFNLSHSRGSAMLAFAHDREVGIDLEAGARLTEDWPALARRIFSVREQAELATLPPGQRRAGFLNGWTRKEAYLKASGLGIVDGLPSIEVTLDPARPAALMAGPAGLNWSIYDLRTDDQFAAALVVQGNDACTIQRFGSPLRQGANPASGPAANRFNARAISEAPPGR